MGSRSATSEVKLSFSSTIANKVDSGNSTSAKVGRTFLTGSIANGADLNKANRAWEQIGRTIASGATIDIDLYDFAAEDIGAGAGNDALGQALVMEEIVSIIIKQTGPVTSPGRLEIQPAGASNPVAWIGAQTVANGGALHVGAVYSRHDQHQDGLPITDASSHILRLGANGGAAKFDICVLGRSVDEESSSTLSSSTSSLSTTTESTSTSDISFTSSVSSLSSSTSTQSSSSFG